MIDEAVALVVRATEGHEIGTYAIQASIAAEHAVASDAASTDWSRIVALYDLLPEAEPTSVVELNRAVAVAMRDGPSAGLVLIDALLARGELGEYRFARAARADLCRRLGRNDEARESYTKALSLTQQDAERRFLQSRIDSL